MTNELEKQFFNTFNIEPIGCNDNKNCTGALDCTQCPNAKYPQITDSILLGLICMANQYEDYPSTTNMKNIQARTLRILLRTEKFYKNYYGKDKGYKNFVKQVRTLFEEG